MRKTRTVMHLLTLLIVIAAVLPAGCGYSVYRKADLPFTEIRIGRIENRTLEPKLQDKLHRALVEEFARQGISVVPSAKNSLSGTVRHFEMQSLAEKKDITVEYRVVIDADFTFTDRDGKTQAIKKLSTPFIVSFAGSKDMALLLAAKERAEEKAAADIAMEIVGSLIFK